MYLSLPCQESHHMAMYPECQSNSRTFDRQQYVERLLVAWSPKNVDRWSSWFKRLG